MKMPIRLMTGVMFCIMLAPSARAMTNRPARTGHIRAVVQDQSDDPSLKKTISKSFPASVGDKVVLSNQFGSIQIKTWDRSEVKADIEIQAYSSKSEDLQQMLDQVEIESTKSAGQIIFRTTMQQEGSWGSGSRSGKRWRREVKINYVVYMPAGNALNMSQNYGNIQMDSFSGPVYVKVQYGDFNAQQLKSSSNYVSVQYGTTRIQEISKGVIKHQYGSGLTIGQAGQLEIDAQYTAVNITTIKGEAKVRQQYGSGLRIGSVGPLDLSAQYCAVDIGNLRGDGKFDIQYNRLNVSEVSRACRSLWVDGSYASISIGFNADYNANLDVTTSYASFRYAADLTVQQINGDQSSTRKSYTGKIGTGTGATVKVKSDYGSVTFK